MPYAEGKCDICAKKIIAETLEDKTDYLHYGDRIIEGCRHYPKGHILTDYEKIMIDL